MERVYTMFYNKKWLPIAASVLLLLTGCKKDATTNKGHDDTGIMPELNYTGDLDILVYIQGMDGEFRDIGSDKVVTSDLTDGNLQKYHAVAKEFNKIYPNITINLLYDNIEEYTNRVIEYQSSHNQKLPHIMHLPVTVQEGLANGYCADLSKYDYFKLYNAIDESVFDYFTFGDFVAAVPFYIYPTGIFVNKDILENNWIDTENLLDNWTFDDMLNYLETVVGATGTSSNIGGTGVLSNDMTDIISSTINETLLTNQTVNLNTNEIIDLIEKENELAQYSVWDYATKAIKPQYNQIQPWSYNTNFIQDELYAMEMSRSYAAGLYSQMIVEQNKVGSFDFLPFPKVTNDDAEEFKIGMIAEGLVVGNQCPLDAAGNENCTQADRDAEEAAAAFALFMAADTRAVESIATTEWLYQGEVISGNYESLPVIKKDIVYPYNENKTDAYDEETYTDENVTLNDYQIQLNHYKKMTEAFNDQEGFQEVLRIFEEDKDNCYAYNTIPRKVPLATGGQEDILEDWNKRFDSFNAVGSTGWVSSVTSQLAEWTRVTNENIQKAWQLLQDNVDSWYGEGKYNIYNG